jgi:hypothetical protein
MFSSVPLGYLMLFRRFILAIITVIVLKVRFPNIVASMLAQSLKPLAVFVCDAICAYAELIVLPAFRGTK